MRFVVVIILISAVSSVMAQSKKELIKKVAAQEEALQKLQAELAELKKPKEVDLSSETKRASYGMGVLLSNNVRSQGGDSLDVEAIVAAVRDVWAHKTLKIEERQCLPIVQKYMQEASEKRSAAAQAESKKFLEENKKVEGVKETASGLQYRVVTEGTGKSPSATSSVTVHYTGKLIDGKVFDSSVNRGQPATFGLNQVIAGWTEGLQLMKEGGKYIFYLPYNLGYGERGSGATIPPYSTLIFEIELIKVN